MIIYLLPFFLKLVEPLRNSKNALISPLLRGDLGVCLQGGLTMKRFIYPYNPKLKELARQLRNNATLAEVLLWQQLKNKQMLGYDFHRQKPILNYIVDFFCHELALAIEIDGISHDSELAIIKDQQRQTDIESLNINFLRFSDEDVKKNLEGVLIMINNWIIAQVNQPTPNPSQEGNFIAITLNHHANIEKISP